MFDESLLDDPDALSRADVSGLLRGAAAAGAAVRTAARHAVEAGVGDLKPDGRPRSVLIAGPGPVPVRVADLLGALAACPVLPVPVGGPAATAHARRWTLPGWAGPLDLLLLATDDGTEPGLVELVEHAYRRGCTTVAVAPAGGPLAAALTQARGFFLPYAATPFADRTPAPADHRDPGVFWGLLVPTLALTDRLGLLSAPPYAIQTLADRLDSAAERFGPAAEIYRNPAKTLTVELAEALPLLWSEGPLSAPVARRFAALLTSRAGRPALAAALPEAVTDHAALLAAEDRSGGDDLSDFFRDRVEEPATPRPRIVLLREPGEGGPGAGGSGAGGPGAGGSGAGGPGAGTSGGSGPGGSVPGGSGPGGSVPGGSAVRAAHDAAADHGTPLSAIDAPPGSPLESLTELLALTDFVSVYLALASRDSRNG